MALLARQLHRLIEEGRRPGGVEALKAAMCIIKQNESCFGFSLSPELLVDFAEIAVALEHYDKATTTIELLAPLNLGNTSAQLRVQLLCGLLEALRGRALCIGGWQLVSQTLSALAIVNEAMHLLTDQKRDRQAEPDMVTIARAFLKTLRSSLTRATYDASIFFISIARPILRPGWKRCLVDVFDDFLAQGHCVFAPPQGDSRPPKGRWGESNNDLSHGGVNKNWRCALILQYASCLEDAGKPIEAFKAVDEAQKLLATDTGAPNPDDQMGRLDLEWNVMLARANLASQSESLIPILRKEAEKHAWSKMAVAAVFCMHKEPKSPGVFEEIVKAWSLVDPRFASSCSTLVLSAKTKNTSRLASPSHETLEKDLAALPPLTTSAPEQMAACLLVRAAMKLGLWHFAELALKRVKNWGSLTCRCTLMQELLYTELQVYCAEFTGRTTQSGASRLRPDAGPQVTESVLSRRARAVKAIEECLLTAEQNVPGSHFVEECAVSLWNMAKLLVQPLHRRRIYRSFKRASEALEAMQSPLTTLRAHLLYQMAVCEAEDYFPGVAKESLKKLLAIDYTVVEDYRQGERSTMENLDGSNRAHEHYPLMRLRPFDFFVKHLYETIRPQRRMYESPFRVRFVRASAFRVPCGRPLLSDVQVIPSDTFETLDQMQLLVDRIKNDLSLQNYISRIEALKVDALSELVQHFTRLPNIHLSPAERLPPRGYSVQEPAKRLMRMLAQVSQEALQHGLFSVATKCCITVLQLVENREPEVAEGLRAFVSANLGSAAQSCADGMFDIARIPFKVQVEVEDTPTGLAIICSCYRLALCCEQVLKSEYKELPGIDVSDRCTQQQLQYTPSLPDAAGQAPAVEETKTTEESKPVKLKKAIIQLILLGTRLRPDSLIRPATVTAGVKRLITLHSGAGSLPHWHGCREFDVTTIDHMRNGDLNNTEHGNRLRACLRPEELFSDFPVGEALTRAYPFLGREGYKDVVTWLFDRGMRWGPVHGCLEQAMSADDEKQRLPMAQATTSALSRSRVGKPQASSTASSTVLAVKVDIPLALFGSEIQALVLMEKLIKEVEPTVKENLVVQCYDIIQLMDAKETACDSSPLSEMKTRLSTRVYDIGSVLTNRLSLALAMEAVGAEAHETPYGIPDGFGPRRTLWRGIGHAVIGLNFAAVHAQWHGHDAVVCLHTALRHLLQACKLATASKNSALILFSCSALWNVVVDLLCAQTVDADVIKALETGLAALKGVNRIDALEPSTKMNIALLSCLSKEKLWNEVVAVAENAFTQLPKSLHCELLRFQLNAIFAGQKDPYADIIEKVKGEGASEGYLLLNCARSAPLWKKDVIKLYERAADILEAFDKGSALRARVELAEVVATSGLCWKDAEDRLRSVVKYAEQAENAAWNDRSTLGRSAEKGATWAATVADSMLPPLNAYLHAKFMIAQTTPKADQLISALSEAITAILNAMSRAKEVKPLDRRPQDKESKADATVVEDQGDACNGKLHADCRKLVHSCAGVDGQSTWGAPLRQASREEKGETDLPCPAEPESKYWIQVESTCLAAATCCEAERLLFQIGLESWAVVILRYREQLLRSLELSLSSSREKDYLRLMRLLAETRLARALHKCGFLADDYGVETVKGAADLSDGFFHRVPSAAQQRKDVASAVTCAKRLALDIVSRKRACDDVCHSQIRTAGVTAVVERFMQSSVPVLLVDLADECHLLMENFSAFKYLSVAMECMDAQKEFTPAGVSMRCQKILASLKLAEGDKEGAITLIEKTFTSYRVSRSGAYSTIVELTEILQEARRRGGYDDTSRDNIKIAVDVAEWQEHISPSPFGAAPAFVDGREVVGTAPKRSAAEHSTSTLCLARAGEATACWAPALHVLWKARLHLADQVEIVLRHSRRVNSLEVPLCPPLSPVLQEAQMEIRGAFELVDNILTRIIAEHRTLVAFLLPIVNEFLESIVNFIESISYCTSNDCDRSTEATSGTGTLSRSCEEAVFYEGTRRATGPPFIPHVLDGLHAMIRRLGDNLCLPELTGRRSLTPEVLRSTLLFSADALAVALARIQRLKHQAPLTQYLADRCSPGIEFNTPCCTTGNYDGGSGNRSCSLVSKREKLKHHVDRWLQQTMGQTTREREELNTRLESLRRVLTSISNLPAAPLATTRSSVAKGWNELNSIPLFTASAARGKEGKSLLPQSGLEISLLCEAAMLEVHIVLAKKEEENATNASTSMCEQATRKSLTHTVQSCEKVRAEVEDQRSVLVEYHANLLATVRGKSQARGTLPIRGMYRHEAQKNVTDFKSGRAQNELENCFWYCIAAGLHERACAAGRLGCALASTSNDSRSREKCFQYLTTLQALSACKRGREALETSARISSLSSVWGQELQRAKRNWSHAATIPRVQELVTSLEQICPFYRGQTMIWKLPSAKILQHICPRLMCILTIQYHDDFLYFAAAVTLPFSETSDGRDCIEYFVDRVYISSVALARSFQQSYDSALKDTDSEMIPTSPESVKDSQTKHRVETILLHLFENFTYKWQQYGLQEKIDSIVVNQVCGELQLQHLLLLVDPFLEHVPFESWDCVRKLFGSHISRDYSLHIFAHRLLAHYDYPQQLSCRRTAAEMHITFNKEFVFTFEDTSSSERLTYSANAFSKDDRHKKTDEDAEKCGRKRITVAAGITTEQGTSGSFESSCSSPPQPPQTSTEDVAELLCTQAPQMLWTSHFEKLRERGVTEKTLIGLDLRHLCIAGIMDLHEHPGATVPLRGGSARLPRQRDVSAYCNIPLLLSFKGVGAIVLRRSRGTWSREKEETLQLLHGVLDAKLRLTQAISVSETSKDRGPHPEKKRVHGLNPSSASLIRGGSQDDPARRKTTQKTAYQGEEDRHGAASALPQPETNPTPEHSAPLVIYGLPWFSASPASKPVKPTPVHKEEQKARSKN